MRLYQLKKKQNPIIIAVLPLYKEKIANTFVSAILNSNGGPDRIRTNDQAVAVPCLTTWLRVHIHLNDFYYT